jgi:hypothetical protein
VKAGEGNIRGFFRSLRVTLWDSDFGFLLVKISFGWTAGVEDCSVDSPCSKRALGYVRTKSCFGLEILNSVSVFVLRHTGRLFSWHFSDTSFEPMWGIGECGRGWLLHVNFGLV